MSQKKRKNSRKKKEFNATRAIWTFLVLIVLIAIGIVSDVFPDEVDNYIESDLNITINETNAIDVFVSTSTSVSSEADLKVYYFDVGQADCELIIADDQTMLIDAGNSADGENLVKYIEALGVEKLDYVIGTHAHEDHIGGMQDIVENFDIGTIYMPDVSTSTTIYENLLEAISDKGLGVSTCNIGDQFTVGDGICTVMSVKNEEQSDLNDNSICLHYVYGDTQFLFMGDASETIEAEISWPDIDILKVGHHGSETSSSESFLEQASPEVAIISCGKNNSYGHPTEETLSRLEAIGATIYRTDESGTILVTSNGSGYDITTITTKIDGNSSTNSSSSDDE